MESTPLTIDQAEAFLRHLAEELTRPRERECLCCYVARLLDDFPCDGSHRHALRYRDAMAPRATALRDRLSRVGACCCDCELFLNGYLPHPSLWPDRADEDDEDGLAIDQLPACTGVRRGSTQPCRNWVRIRRRRW